MMTTVKLNNILYAHNNGKKYFDTVIAKKFENRTKNTKDMGKYVKHIKIAKNLLKGSLTAIVSFLKTPGNLILISITKFFLKIGP